MPIFDAMWTENLEIFELRTLIFCSFFDNQLKIGGERGQSKKKWGGYRSFKKETASELNKMAASPIGA